jgi:hypothetical protein
MISRMDDKFDIQDQKILGSEKRLIARMDDKFDIQDKKILGVEQRLKDEIRTSANDLGERIDDLAAITKRALDRKVDLEYA